MPVVELASKGADHALKCMLACIAEVEVEVEEGLMRKGSLKIFNDCGAKNRLSTSGNAIEPQEGVLLCLPSRERITL